MISCQFEDGFKVKLRHVTVNTIVLNSQKEVLLVKRALHLSRGNKYTVPGGYLDRDEDTKTAALRELKEETGYLGKIIRLFQINDYPNRPHEDRQNVDFTYIAEITGGEITQNKEVISIEWFPFEKLPSVDEFAFDHRKIIERYLSYLKNPFELPIIGGA